MGIDLTLCPSRYNAAHEWFLAYDRLSLDRNYDLQGKIQALGEKLLPATWNFDWYGDEGIERRTENPYGSPLTYLDAGQFSAIPLEKLSPWNRAVIQFCQALPPQTPIVLWWH